MTDLLTALKNRKNAKYWSRRFELLEYQTTHQASDYLKRLEREYKQAAQATQDELDKWYARFATEEGITKQEARKRLDANELDAFHMSVEEYIKKGETLNYSNAWAKELGRASTKYHVSRLESLHLHLRQQVMALHGKELADVEDLLVSLYGDRYYRTAFEIQKGFGVGLSFANVDDNRISKILRHPWTADGKTFSSRIWTHQAELNSDLERILVQGIATGRHPSDMSRAIAKRFDVAESRAENLVRTESAYFAAEGQRDCFTELGVNRYEIVSTLDNKTSEICRSLDGEVFPMSEYKVGITAPPFHCRCRTTTAPSFCDEFEIGTMRAARDENGKTIMVPADMKYEEWRAYYDAKEKEPEITKFMKATARRENLDIVGLDYRIKSLDSYHRKAKAASTKGEINDIIRYTFTSSPDKLANRVVEAIGDMKAKGYETIVVKNSWLDKKNPYKGINTTVVAPNDQKFELQYHTPESFDLKNGKLHELYERQRVLTDRLSKEWVELQDEMFELSKGLKVPTNIEKVK